MTTKSNIVVKRVQRAESQPVVHIGKSGMSLTPISAKGKTNAPAAWTSNNVVSKKISLRGHQKALSRRTALLRRHPKTLYHPEHFGGVQY